MKTLAYIALLAVILALYVPVCQQRYAECRASFSRFYCLTDSVR